MQGQDGERDKERDHERDSRDRDRMDRERDGNGSEKSADEESGRFVEVRSSATAPTLVIGQSSTPKGQSPGFIASQPTQSQANPHVQRVGAHNVPVETVLGESAHEYVVFLRTIPSTKARCHPML